MATTAKKNSENTYNLSVVVTDQQGNLVLLHESSDMSEKDFDKLKIFLLPDLSVDELLDDFPTED